MELPEGNKLEGLLSLREVIVVAMEERIKLYGGNKLQAAKSLGISRATVYRYLAEYNRVNGTE